MASNRSRANNTLGTRLNSLSSKIDDQEAKNRGNSDDTIKERLDALESQQEQLSSPNYRVEQESPFLMDAFPILSGGSSGQPIGPATEAKAGLVELATQDEATLVSTSGPANLSMTPQRVLDAINTFAPVTARGQKSLYVSDLNLAIKSGFVRSDTAGTNIPPGQANSQYLVLVHSGDSVDVGGSGAGYIVQEAYEVYSTGVRQIWTRSRDAGTPFPWTAWAPATGSTVKEGTVRLATVAEATTGTSQAVAATPAGVKAVGDTKAPLSHTHTASQITDFNTAADARVNAVVLPATTGTSGKAALATNAEVQAGTVTDKIVTPSGLNSRVASDTATGLVELATPAEATTGTDTARAVTPQGLKTVTDTKAPLSHTHTASQITDFNTAADARVNALVPPASTTVAGKLLLATDADTQAGTVNNEAVTPSSLNSRTATETRTGIGRLADQWEAIVHTGNFTDTLMTPRRVQDAINTFAPIVARGRGGVVVTDWNTCIATGFYVGSFLADGSGSLNSPPITGAFYRSLAGIVIDSSEYGINMGSGGPRIQIVWEYYSVGTNIDQETGTVLRQWSRVAVSWVAGDPSSLRWGPWRSSDGSTTNIGDVRLATTAEATTGTAQDIAVTPAGLKTVADTKAPLSHTHVLANITDMPARASAATANALIQRDASGRAQIATPSVAADIATKGYVDSLTSVNTGRGSTAERDAYFGTPTVLVDQVTLANRSAVWWNTDLGWQESYYVPSGSSGLSVLGLLAGTQAGWYPTGRGPECILEPNAQINTPSPGPSAYVQGWAGTVTRRGGSAWFTNNAGALFCNVAGYYDLRAWTIQQTGAGIMNYHLVVLNNAGTVERTKHDGGAFGLNSSFYTTVDMSMQSKFMNAGDQLLLRAQASGPVAVHMGTTPDTRGQMIARYVRPPLVSA